MNVVLPGGRGSEVFLCVAQQDALVAQQRVSMKVSKTLTSLEQEKSSSNEESSANVASLIDPWLEGGTGGNWTHEQAVKLDCGDPALAALVDLLFASLSGVVSG